MMHTAELDSRCITLSFLRNLKHLIPRYDAQELKYILLCLLGTQMGSNHEINRGQKLCFAVTVVERVVADSWVGILKHFVILIIVLQYFKLRFKDIKLFITHS